MNTNRIGQTGFRVTAQEYQPPSKQVLIPQNELVQSLPIGMQSLSNFFNKGRNGVSMNRSISEDSGIATSLQENELGEPYTNFLMHQMSSSNSQRRSSS
jgi:hypothetical protein